LTFKNKTKTASFLPATIFSLTFRPRFSKLLLIFVDSIYNWRCPKGR